MVRRCYNARIVGILVDTMVAAYNMVPDLVPMKNFGMLRGPVIVVHKYPRGLPFGPVLRLIEKAKSSRYLRIQG